MTNKINPKMKNGFYWVLYPLQRPLKNKRSMWIIAEYLRGNWYFQSCQYSLPDNYFIKIGPRIIPPPPEG